MNCLGRASEARFGARRARAGVGTLAGAARAGRVERQLLFF